jgi:hypothetical protein
VPAWLITQRSQVQILPRYQVSAGQGPDRRRRRSAFCLLVGDSLAGSGRVVRIRSAAFGGSLDRARWLPQIGWDESLTEQQLYDIARGTWATGRRVKQERYAVVSGAGAIRQAIEIDRIVDDGIRRSFEGRVLQPGGPVYDLYVGKPAPNGRQQKPIT